MGVRSGLGRGPTQLATKKPTAGLGDTDEAAKDAASPADADQLEQQRLELEAEREALRLRAEQLQEREDAIERKGHEMRVHTLTAAEPVHERYDDLDDFAEVGVLDTTHIPPRDGFTQRWIRTHVAGQPDVSNVQRQLNRKWQPRKADTVAEGIYVPTIQDGRFGNVIGVEGMMLMERPSEIHARHGKAIRRDAAAQMESVDNSLFRAHEQGKGLGAPTRDHQSSVDVGGRPMAVAED